MTDWIQNNNIFIGRDKELKQINEWLEIINNKTEINIKTGLVIGGRTGVGKKTLIKKALEMNEYEYIDFYDFTVSELSEAVKASKSIKFSVFLTKPSKKKAIIFNEIEHTINKGLLSAILKILRAQNNNETKQCIPLIFIVNIEHIKTIQSIQKESLVIKLGQFKKKEIKVLLDEIIKVHGLKCTNSVKPTIIKRSENDIRRLFFIMNELSLTGKQKKINDKLLEQTVWGQTVDSFFTSDNEIVTKYINIKNINDINNDFALYNTSIDSLYFENYIRGNLGNFDENSKTLIMNIADASEALSLADTLCYQYNLDGSKDKEEYDELKLGEEDDDRVINDIAYEIFNKSCFIVPSIIINKEHKKKVRLIRSNAVNYDKMYRHRNKRNNDIVTSELKIKDHTQLFYLSQMMRKKYKQKQLAEYYNILQKEDDFTIVGDDISKDKKEKDDRNRIDTFIKRNKIG